MNKISRLKWTKDETKCKFVWYNNLAWQNLIDGDLRKLPEKYSGVQILDIRKQHCIWWETLEPAHQKPLKFKSINKHEQSVNYWNFIHGYQSLCFMNFKGMQHIIRALLIHDKEISKVYQSWAEEVLAVFAVQPMSLLSFGLGLSVDIAQFRTSKESRILVDMLL